MNHLFVNLLVRYNIHASNLFVYLSIDIVATLNIQRFFATT